jgi:hypothetical protein
VNVSLRNFAFVLILSVPVLLVPTGAAADDCGGSCTDIETVNAYCGPVCGYIQPADQCVLGCTCGFCRSIGYGECHCYLDNKYYKYESYGIIPEIGDCNGQFCGPRRVHVRESSASPPPSARVGDLQGTAAEGDAAWRPILTEERMFVFSRCSHTYVMFVPKASPKLPIGGM